jgi:hypothetical protein
MVTGSNYFIVLTRLNNMMGWVRGGQAKLTNVEPDFQKQLAKFKTDTEVGVQV